jgi:hypothetical protein
MSDQSRVNLYAPLTQTVHTSAAGPMGPLDDAPAGAEPEALTQIVRLIQLWAQQRNRSSAALAQEVEDAQRTLPGFKGPPVKVSESWLKRVRSGRLLPSAETGAQQVDARYRALFVLIGQCQLSGASSGRAGGTVPPPRELEHRSLALAELWSGQLLRHWSARESAADSQIQAADPLGVVEAFSEPVDAEHTRNADLQALGAKLGRFLINAAVSTTAREPAMQRIHTDRAAELVAKLGPGLAHSPRGMEGADATTNRFIRTALTKLLDKLNDGQAELHPLTAIILVPVLERLIEVSCELRRPSDPTLYAWLSAVVATK